MNDLYFDVSLIDWAKSYHLAVLNGTNGLCVGSVLCTVLWSIGNMDCIHVGVALSRVQGTDSFTRQTTSTEAYFTSELKPPSIENLWFKFP